ncbi:MAG: ATP-binding protein [Lentimicrobiaceae bacterium]|jgi:signal transduction histidine kinase/DNA-binding response OmpR family regulator
MKRNSLSKLFQSIDGRVGRILAFPGISNKELITRKSNWYANCAAAVATLLMISLIYIYMPKTKLLYGYGIGAISAQVFILTIYLTKPRNTLWPGLIHMNFLMLLTIVYIILLGGILYSGGLIFMAFSFVFFSLFGQKAWITLELMLVFISGVIISVLLQPILNYTPIIPSSVNLIYFIGNILLFSIILLVFLFYSIRKSIEMEQVEAKRLQELDEVKTKLFTNITHEFRTPLTIILGMASLVKEKPGEWLETGTEKIRNNSQNLLHLVNQMLDLSKLESGAMPLHIFQQDIILQLRYLLELFRSMALSRNIRLRFIPESDHFLMDYDADKMMHIVTNLISNALKYIQDGGSVLLTTGLLPTNESNEFLIRIKDDGPGIPAEHMPFIFDRFYRIEGNVTQYENGSGLGLALTKELVKLMKGNISVESKPGKGTIFIVQIPVTNQAPLKEMAGFSDAKDKISAFLPSLKKVQEKPEVDVKDENDRPILLVVEDSPDLIEYLSAILGNEYHLEIASNGREGLQKAMEYIPDIILSDVMMPKMDGIALLEKLKTDQRTSHIPVVMLTAKADIVSKLIGLERGADDYLAKPFNEDELHIRLKKLIELRKVLRQRYASMETLPKTDDKAIKIEDAFMLKIRSIMEAHLDNDQFGIQQLCKEIGMSRAQLYRKFKSLTDKTVNDYLINFRLFKAKEMLLNSDLHVSEVAWEVGFKNLSHFSRSFTREFGKNPSEIHK